MHERCGMDCRGSLMFVRCAPVIYFFFFFSSRRRHTRYIGDWSSDVCSSDLLVADLVRRVDPARFDSHVLALRFLGRNARGLEPASRLHVAAPLPRWTMLWPRPLIRQIRELAPDVVHTHSGVWYKASLAARWAGVPRLIHTDHGRPYPDPLGTDRKSTR